MHVLKHEVDKSRKDVLSGMSCFALQRLKISVSGKGMKREENA